MTLRVVPEALAANVGAAPLITGAGDAASSSYLVAGG